MSFLITFTVKVKSTTVQGSRNHPRENVKANLVIGNIPVANGVVHLIDKPLIIVASPLWDYLQEEVRLSSMLNVLQRNQWPHLSVNLGFHDMEQVNKVYILGHILSGENMP